MTWEAAPTGKRGRQQDYSDASIQTYLTMKVLFGMALRQKTLKVNIPYRGSDGPLHPLIDSTGIKVEGEAAETSDVFDFTPLSGGH